MVNKTVVIDVNVHKQIVDYQNDVRKNMGYELQIKEIIANAVSEYIKMNRMGQSKVENSKTVVLTEFPIPKKE